MELFVNCGALTIDLLLIRQLNDDQGLPEKWHMGMGLHSPGGCAGDPLSLGYARG